MLPIVLANGPETMASVEGGGRRWAWPGLIVILIKLLSAFIPIVNRERLKLQKYISHQVMVMVVVVEIITTTNLDD